MKVSYKWLQELININKTPQEIADNFYLSGLEVETIIKTGIGNQPVYAGEIISIEKHPEADRLSVLQFDFGSLGKRQIITNLTGLNVGDKILVSLEGAVLADGTKIKQAKLKGVESFGMIVGWEELGIPQKSETAIYLPKSTLNGTPYSEIADFNDSIIDIDLTANRGDCLGMIGIRREIKCQFGGDYAQMPVTYKTISDKVDNEVAVEIQTEGCGRYCAAVIKDVKIEPSPLWMQLKLIKSGIRPINNIVDITNYILMECNQPLHAFDKDTITDNRVIVRGGKQNEKLISLDNIEREIMPDDVIIADKDRGLCIGGVMGGLNSEITDNTKNIFLESAFFRGTNIRRTSKRLGLKSEASFRFERTIDIDNCAWALQRALYYFDLLGVGKICSGIIDIYPNKQPQQKVSLTSDWINNKLGSNIPAERMREILTNLGFGVEGTANNLDITVPYWRSDVSIKEDISEEIARIYGLNNIEPTFYPSHNAANFTKKQKLERDLREILYGCGCDEALNLSFVGDSLFDKMQLTSEHSYRKIVRMEDYLSEDLQGMRSALIPGMLRTLSLNASRNNNNVSIFEVGNISIPTGNELPDEFLHASVALMGNRYEKDYTTNAVKYDFYDIKGIADVIFDNFAIKPQYRVSKENFLHPNQQAEIFANNKKIGLIGKVHPVIAESFEISDDSFLLEISVDDLCELATEQVDFQEVPKFPSSERDLSLIISNDITSEQIINEINSLKIDILKSIKIFDIYRDDKIAANCYSISINFFFNKVVSTLTDKEVDEQIAKILKHLQDKFNAQLR